MGRNSTRRRITREVKTMEKRAAGFSMIDKYRPDTVIKIHSRPHQPMTPEEAKEALLEHAKNLRMELGRMKDTRNANR